MPRPNLGATTGRVQIRTHAMLLWRGPKVLDEIKKKDDAIVTAVATFIMEHAKSNVHQVSGTLFRSIKVEKPGVIIDRTDAARNRSLGHPIPKPERIDGKAQLTVGGTTFYAVYEELRHPYMQPAMDASRGIINDIVKVNQLP